MSTYARALSAAVLNGLRACKTQPLEVFQQQSRKMGGGGGGAPWYRAYNGKPPPASMQGPDFITYAGLTLPKNKPDVDYWFTKGLGTLFWFTLAYHFSLNWGEHVYGDIGFFEMDVQANGWDDENGHGHGHGHGHKAAAHASSDGHNAAAHGSSDGHSDKVESDDGQGQENAEENAKENAEENAEENQEENAEDNAEEAE